MLCLSVYRLFLPIHSWSFIIICYLTLIRVACLLSYYDKIFQHFCLLFRWAWRLATDYYDTIVFSIEKYPRTWVRLPNRFACDPIAKIRNLANVSALLCLGDVRYGTVDSFSDVEELLQKAGLSTRSLYEVSRTLSREYLLLKGSVRNEKTYAEIHV